MAKLARAGDSIYIVHAENWGSRNAEDGPAIEARRRLVAAAAEWQAACTDACAPLVNVAVDVVAHSSSPEEGMEGNAGEGAGLRLGSVQPAVLRACVQVSASVVGGWSGGTLDASTKYGFLSSISAWSGGP